LSIDENKQNILGKINAFLENSISPLLRQLKRCLPAAA